MPWLTIFMMIVSFFLQGGAKKENRAKAAATALGVGAATYGVTHYTEWGQQNLGYLDGVEFTGTGAATQVTAQDGSNVVKPTLDASGKPGSTTTAGTTGFWNTLSGWLRSPAGQATTGAAGAKALGMPSWLIWAAGGLIAYKAITT